MQAAAAEASDPPLDEIDRAIKYAIDAEAFINALLDKRNKDMPRA